MKKVPSWIWAWVGTALVVGLVLAFRRKGGKPPQKILFVGDSITAIEWNGKPTNTYPILIKKQVPQLTIDVLAIGGKTTKWMLDNLPSKINNGYDRIYIYGGVNDAFTQTIKLDTTLSNVQKMVDIAKQSGAEPYVVIGYEPNGFMDYKKMPLTRYIGRKEDYIPLIERYKQLQAKYLSIKGAKFVPKFQLGSNTGDGTHPNGVGQKIIATDIMNTF